LWAAGSDTCYNCGAVRERSNLVHEVKGMMEELSGTAPRESKQDFWNEMMWYIKVQGWSRGRAANTYRDKFGVWPRTLSDDRPCMPSDETRRFIDRKLKQFLRSKGKR
jgi:hypothetical protein